MDNQRPLSPHLQRYKWEWTMTFSILCRFSGLINGAGLIAFCWWLFSIYMGPAYYAVFSYIASFTLAKIVIYLLIWSMFFHLCLGFRYFLWDMGFLFKNIKRTQASGYIALILSIILTLVILWVSL